MIFLGGGTGSFIRSMPITVVAALMASLLIALTLTPYLTGRLLRTDATQQTTRMQRVLNRFIEGSYRKTLVQSVRRPFVTIGMAMLLLAGSFLLFPYVGFTLFPKAEKTQFLIDINTPEGTRLEETDTVVRYVESVLDEHADVKLYASNVGRGNPRIYYNESPNAEKSTYGQVLVEIRSREDRDRNRVVTELRQSFSRYPGARITVKELAQGPGIEAPVAIRVVGENLDMIRDLATEVESIITDTKGTDNIDNPLSMPRTNLFVDVNREKAGLLGLGLVDIDRTVRAGISGLPISTYRDPTGDEFDIVVRLPNIGDPRLSDFDRMAVHSQSGASIPLKQVADIKFKAGLPQINHFNFERSVTITVNVLEGYRVNGVTQDIIDQLNGFNWPGGYRYEIGGELAETQESFGSLLQALLVALFGIFGVLVLQFRSFGQPLIVFAAIPLAIIGAIGALFVTGNSFSFTAGVGLTSLVGIVINNAIILVDYANQLRDEGSSIIDAMQQAAEARFVPILLTTLTTIGGLLPLTLTGSTLWAPFGWTVIGGLITSMLMTLLLVPVLYKLFTRERVGVQ
jgi:multidrug efflux pump subunit AcrB